jgi:hypothetical protein
MGLGPQAVGLLSDALEPRLGVESVRYALVLVLGTSAIGAACLAMAARTLPADLARADA